MSSSKALRRQAGTWQCSTEVAEIQSKSTIRRAATSRSGQGYASHVADHNKFATGVNFNVNMFNHTVAPDLRVQHQRTEGKHHLRSPHDLKFLNQHCGNASATSNPRSKSHFIGFNKTQTSGGTTAGILRMRKNLYDQNKQIMRYKSLNKSGNLASRLNRNMPAATNFPEEGSRNKNITGFETSIKFKLSEA